MFRQSDKPWLSPEQFLADEYKRVADYGREYTVRYPVDGTSDEFSPQPDNPDCETQISMLQGSFEQQLTRALEHYADTNRNEDKVNIFRSINNPTAISTLVAQCQIVDTFTKQWEASEVPRLDMDRLTRGFATSKWSYDDLKSHINDLAKRRRTRVAHNRSLEETVLDVIASEDRAAFTDLCGKLKEVTATVSPGSESKHVLDILADLTARLHQDVGSKADSSAGPATERSDGSPFTQDVVRTNAGDTDARNPFSVDSATSYLLNANNHRSDLEDAKMKGHTSLFDMCAVDPCTVQLREYLEGLRKDPRALSSLGEHEKAAIEGYTDDQLHLYALRARVGRALNGLSLYNLHTAIYASQNGNMLDPSKVHVNLQDLDDSIRASNDTEAALRTRIATSFTNSIKSFREQSLPPVEHLDKTINALSRIREDIVKLNSLQSASIDQ